MCNDITGPFYVDIDSNNNNNNIVGMVDLLDNVHDMLDPIACSAWLENRRSGWILVEKNVMYFVNE